MLNSATETNLRRKSAHVDSVQMHEGKPLFSWLDLSLTELCNRKCVFCPRVDEEAYPNQPLHMSLDLVRKIAGELHDLSYEGSVVLCGYGEPMLHPRLEEVVHAFGDIRVEMVTNGDRLSVEKIKNLSEAGLDYFVVSMYDGEHQIDQFDRMFEAAGCWDFILRDRWHKEDQDYGLKLTNRAGTVTIGEQPPVDVTHPCFYLAYQLTVDWNGDVVLCSQDWHKKIKLGNLMTDRAIDVWHSVAMHKRRSPLLRGDRSSSPCSGCNADGTMHGRNHAEAWKTRR